MSKWEKRFRTVHLGYVEVGKEQMELVAFEFEVEGGSKYSFGWSMAIPEAGLVFKRHFYTKNRIETAATWYLRGLKRVEGTFSRVLDSGPSDPPAAPSGPCPATPTGPLHP